ncbi:MAG: sensor histidine kinase, partial [Sphingomicrobium sp.]
QEIRCLAFLNHPASMNAGGLASALDALMSGFGKRTGFRVTCRVSGEPAPHDGAASFTLLRIAQEALVNVHRHAHATAVDVRLKRLGNFLGLSIADNGVGMPSSNELACRGGVGVQGMRFRVEKLGGRFAITNLEHGTRITAIVPMAE